MAQRCIKQTRVVASVVRLGYLVLAVNLFIFLFCAYVLFSDERIRNVRAKNTEIDQSVQSPTNFAFKTQNKSSEKKHKHNEMYIKNKYDEESETDGEVPPHFTKSVSSSLEEGPPIGLKIEQRMGDENNGTRREDQKVKFSEGTHFSQSKLARRNRLTNHRQKPKKTSRVNSFDVRGALDLSKDIQSDNSSSHDALLKESVADDFPVTRSRKWHHDIPVSPALSRASSVNAAAYISDLLAWEGSPVLSRGCRLKHLNITSMVFVKVHKSASTTIANILARYALRYGLQVALPRKVPKTKRFNYFDEIITRDSVFPPLGNDFRYNMMFNHMIFNRSNVQRLMPNNTFYFAIMRHPEERFVSSFYYYGLAKTLQTKFNTSHPSEALSFFLRTYNQFNVTKPELYNSFAGSTGLAPEKQRDPKNVHNHATSLQRDLHLVLVVEYFDESLVLLKRRACLRMKDILYLRKNARKTNTEFVISNKDRLLFRRYQMADFFLYDYFYRIFWDNVLAEGTAFFLELRRFREIQAIMDEFCFRNSSGLRHAYVEASIWNERFVITRRDCFLLQQSEISMQTYLLRRARTWLALSKNASV